MVGISINEPFSNCQLQELLLNDQCSYLQNNENEHIVPNTTEESTKSNEKTVENGQKTNEEMPLEKRREEEKWTKLGNLRESRLSNRKYW